ncbi:MAG: hypothetical protein JW925_04960 [Syntrophaceae bacterium]|nr:hypothetical protein [Syntrophaceae bacterium]
MSRLGIALCIVFTVTTVALSGEIYICVDGHGNTVVTSIPQDGMKHCVLKDSYQDQSAKESESENKNVAGGEDKQVENKEEDNKELEKRIENCINCCSEKKRVCYNYTANDRLCIAEQQNCTETCNSKGTAPSSWSDCWSKSENQ